MKSIIVTGGRGFIGFNAIRLWKKIRPDLEIVCVDANTYADRFLQDEKDYWLDSNGIPRFVIDLGKDDGFEALDSISETFGTDAIVHFGAESHVDNSIATPKVFFDSNVTGTVNVLNVCRKRGIRLHFVSTDEVYGVTYPNSVIGVDSPFRPSSPYSASKCAADLAVQSYMKTYGIKATISRCSNNFGPWQMTEKLIPTIVKRISFGLKVPVYGDGSQCRQWIPVDDHNRAILDMLEGSHGRICNVSSNMFGYRKNLDIIRYIAEEMGKRLEDVVEHVTDRPAHDVSYYIPNYENLNYGNDHIDEELSKTVHWYMERF